MTTVNEIKTFLLNTGKERVDPEPAVDRVTHGNGEHKVKGWP